MVKEYFCICAKFLNAFHVGDPVIGWLHQINWPEDLGGWEVNLAAGQVSLCLLCANTLRLIILEQRE